jgi:hypothetical protein
MLRRLTQPEHDLGEALADHTMVIDFRKPKILKGLVTKRGRNPGHRHGRIGAPVAHLIKQVAKLGCIIQ